MNAYMALHVPSPEPQQEAAEEAGWRRKHLLDVGTHLHLRSRVLAEDEQRRIGSFLGVQVRAPEEGWLLGPCLDKFLAGVGGWSAAGTRVR